MTTPIVCDDWTEQLIGETEYQFAPTSDPQVLAITERDPYVQISDLYAGDAINPIIYVEHRHGLSFSWIAGYDGGEAALMQKAYDEWGWNGTARRYLWIFHGIAAGNADGGYDQGGNWIVATSSKYRERIGVIEEPATYVEAFGDTLAITEDLSMALDGDVYGAGFATNEARRLHDNEEINLNDWDIEMTCWGLVGERCARSECFSYGEPSLSEMLAVTA